MTEGTYMKKRILGMDVVVTDLVKEHVLLMDKEIFEAITGGKIWDRYRMRREMAKRRNHREYIESKTKYQARQHEACYP